MKKRRPHRSNRNVNTAAAAILISLLLILAGCSKSEAPVGATGGKGSSGGGSATAAETSGNYIADLGFRSDKNGFSFPNYGAGNYQNLTPDTLKKMFGDQVCANTAGGCTLTPAGQQWMEAANQSMAGGHCEGMAALSLLFFSGKDNPTTYGAPDTPGLPIDGNTPLQGEIARWFATQATQPGAGEDKSATPNDVVQKLKDSFGTGGQASDTYVLGIYQPQYQAGHAITPYALEDRGNGVMWILVYDNNFPGIPRAVEVNTTANTWTYTASTNPNEPAAVYSGDASTKTLTLAPTSVRLQPQVCPFCSGDSQGSGGQSKGSTTSGAAPVTTEYNQVWLESPDPQVNLKVLGDAPAMAMGSLYQTVGMVNGVLVNEIPGAKIETLKSDVEPWKADLEPTYFIPRGINFKVVVDGSALKQKTTGNLTMTGPGYDLAVDNITLDPGQVDTVSFSADGQKISYESKQNESPDILVGFDGPSADYALEVKGFDLGKDGGTVNVGLDKAAGRLQIDPTGTASAATYGVSISRIDEASTQVFSHNDVVLEPNDIAYVDYGAWTGKEKTIPLLLDRGSTGTPNETIELTDQD